MAAEALVASTGAGVGVAGDGAIGAAAAVEANRIPAPICRRRAVLGIEEVFVLGKAFVVERKGLALMARLEENCLG